VKLFVTGRRPVHLLDPPSWISWFLANFNGPVFATCTAKEADVVRATTGLSGAILAEVTAL